MYVMGSYTVKHVSAWLDSYIHLIRIYFKNVDLIQESSIFNS